jgi:hypothetical protein
MYYPWSNYNFGGRILNHIVNGNVSVIKILLEIGFLNVNDHFDITKEPTLLHVIARYGCAKYKDMIDLLLQYGINIDKPSTSSVVSQAIIFKNFAIAAYIYSKGGIFDRNEVNIYNTISDVDLFEHFNYEISRLAN